MSKPKLLWIGDACVASGFARVTHRVLEGVREAWDVHVLGLNYRGDPHPYPYPVYPCWPGGDMFGVRRTKELIKKLEIDLVVVQNDPWNIPAYAKEIGQTPFVAIMPVDGKNCRGAALNGLDHAIFWTEFGRVEAQRGGYKGPSSVIPLGVDLGMYHPRDRVAARRFLGFGSELDEVFVVGNVNRNQPRKRLDLTLAYFYDWLARDGVDDAYLYLHVCPTGDEGYDIPQLAAYLHNGAHAGRLVLATPEIGHGVPEAELAQMYAAFDLQVSTTQGEGWGLTTLEGMACGVPQLVPNWSALGDWASGAAYLVPPGETCVTWNGINVVGAPPEREAFIEGLRTLYRDRRYREAMGAHGLELAKEPRYRWDVIARDHLRIFNHVYAARQAA
jgi:D-inositol-3-phosphate glycosyltransferase